jgi:hypothetical protein
MPDWNPEPIWKGEEAFIIGGGPSLRGFDWSLLIDEHTVGCNNAFRLGPEVCKIVVFCDKKFILGEQGRPREGFYDMLSVFPNSVITNDTQLRYRPEKWILWMQRRPVGLHHDALGYNANTGAAAINVAILLGATTIYLLGFDMHLDPQRRPNWHDHQIDKPSEEVYVRMLAAFGHVSKDLRQKFPGYTVINVTDDSDLQIFSKVGTKEFWDKRKEQRQCKIQSNGGSQQQCGQPQSQLSLVC